MAMLCEAEPDVTPCPLTVIVPVAVGVTVTVEVVAVTVYDVTPTTNIGVSVPAVVLMWDDIDFGTTVLNLRRAVSFGVGRSLIIVTTNCRKNHTREIPIDPFLLSLFKAEKENLNRPKSLYIFSSASGELIKPDNFARTYQKFFRHLNAWCIKNEKPEVRKLTPHECRHTYASLLLRRGVDSRIRQALLGQLMKK
jgi:integrase